MSESMAQYHEWIDGVVDHLNKLLQLEFDASLTYKDALDHVDDALVRADLQRFLQEHERHIIELSQTIRALGGTPIELERDFTGALLEGVTKLRSRRGTVGALKAMRMNERHTNRVYRRASEVYMPPIGQVAVLEHLGDERRHLAAVEAHIERLTGPHDDRAEQVRRERTEPRPGWPGW